MATWNPWHTLESVRRELDRVFDDAGTRAARHSARPFCRDEPPGSILS